MCHPAQTRRHAFAVAGAYLVCSIIVLAPILSARVPGLGDTMNHLARMHILASIDGSPALQRFYFVHWTPIPYLAMDAVVPLLLRVMPIYAAGKLFTVACVLLPVAGAAALHYAVHRRASLVPCAAFLFSTNMLLSLGFLNFLFTLGLALLLLAGWIAASGWPRWRRAALFAPFVLVLYFGHAFACAAYCLGVAGVELGVAWRGRFRPAARVAANLVAAGAQAVPALYFAATLDVASGYVGKLHTQYGDAAEKLAALLSPVLYLNDWVHLGVAGLGLAVLALIGRQTRLSAILWPAGLVVALAGLAMPHVLSSTWGTDLRLPLAFAQIIVGSLSVQAGRFARAALFLCLLGLLGAKSADAWIALRRVDAAFAETRKVLAVMPVGSRLLVVNLAGQGTGHEAVPLNTVWHLPLVAVIDRDAFVPTLFTGLTTVRVQPSMRGNSTPNGLLISLPQLWEGLAPGDALERDDGRGARLYHFGWPAHFDYVLVQRFGLDAGRLPPILQLVGTSPQMDLYRVGRP